MVTKTNHRADILKTIVLFEYENRVLKGLSISLKLGAYLGCDLDIPLETTTSSMVWDIMTPDFMP